MGDGTTGQVLPAHSGGARRPEAPRHRGERPRRRRPVGALLTAVLLGALVTAVVPAPAAQAYGTTADQRWYPTDGTVYAMVVSGDVVYLGGTFTSWVDPATGARAARSRLAAVDADTGALLPWNPGADAVVRALAVGADGTVYAGGDFTRAGGGRAERIAALTPGGAPLAGFAASADDVVRDLVAGDGELVVAGNFTRVGGVRRVGVAEVDGRTGSTDPTFDAGVGQGRVRALARDGDRLYLGGSFRTLRSQPRSFIAAVSATDGAPTDWLPNPACDDCPLLDLTLSGDNVVAAVGGPGGRVVNWSAVTARTRWTRNADGDVQTVAVHGGQVYAGGHFGPRFYLTTRHQLAVLDLVTAAVQSYAIPFVGNDHPGLWAVQVDADAVRLGGGFALAGSPVRRFATFR
ncbi:hypothetical protein GCM10023340_04180 [Nocardioides marinquilinus]|uniref:Uncharacterized protein n=1 Tax=Nocardioides marinquilinus TaxID=1210400 RepID=A0ABP9P8V3_9ACTN